MERVIFGAVAHGDGAVDLAYKEVPAKDGWHHIVVTFDGSQENVLCGRTIKCADTDIFVCTEWKYSDRCLWRSQRKTLRVILPVPVCTTKQ